MDCRDEEYGESFNNADIDAYPFALEIAAPISCGVLPT